jgi:hypothetical protein
MPKMLGDWKTRTMAEKLEFSYPWPRGAELETAIAAYHSANAAAESETERAALRMAFVRDYGMDAPDSGE